MGVLDEYGFLGGGPWEQMVEGPWVSQCMADCLGSAEAREREREAKSVRMRGLERCIAAIW